MIEGVVEMGFLRISLLQMSFSGAVLIMVLVVLRTLFLDRFPKRMFCALWELVLVRLLIPFSITSGISIYSLFSRGGDLDSPAGVQGQAGLPLKIPISAGMGTVKDPVGKMGWLPGIWTMVWFAGVLLLAGYFLAAYCYTRRRLTRSLCMEDAIITDTNSVLNGGRRRLLSGRTVSLRESDYVKSPLTYGILHPVILLPVGMVRNSREELSFVLAHETAHIRYFDGLAKLVMTAALCVHWFNPLVWVMFILFNRDIELACDESVIRQFGQGARSAYANALITMEEGKNRFRPLCNYFSENAMEERILSIMKTKRTKIGVLAACAAVFVVLAVLLGTSVIAENDVSRDGWAVSDGLDGDGTVDAVIRGLSGDMLTVDVMEYITDDDAERKQELIDLGVIQESDMQDGLFWDGYFIYNQEEKLLPLPLAKEVCFDMIDWFCQFTGSGTIERYVTYDAEEFRQYLENYDLDIDYRKLPPFILEYRNGEVVSVKEVWVN